MTTSPDGSSGGRVAIVTGGSRGVGQAVVRRLADQGYAVVVNYLHDQRAAESAVEMVLAERGAAVAVRADVADYLDVERMFAETVTEFGGIDVAVHTVGARVAAAPVAGIDLITFDAMSRLNTRAAFIVNREAARHLRRGGAIVNLTGAADGSTLRTHGAYAATSAATDVLTRALALELRQRDITVNAVALEVDRPCAPDRIADIVVYLLGDRGRRLTGQVLQVGQLAVDPGQGDADRNSVTRSANCRGYRNRSPGAASG